MIYDFPDFAAPLKQGDVFGSVPRLDISLRAVHRVTDEGITEQPWSEVARGEGGELEAVVPIKAVAAIVISQDCDAARNPDISLCEVRAFESVYPWGKEGEKPAKKWMSVLTEHARRNPKWFYLPPQERVFEGRMAADFLSVFRLSREELEAYRENRIATLAQVARNHFRERIGEFYRRYPYDEWYPLNKEEFAAYKEKYPDAEAFPGQAKR